MSDGLPKSGAEVSAEVAAYRAEWRAVGRKQRLAAVGCVVVGAIIALLAPYAGSAGPVVQWVGYAVLAMGWGLMLYGIFLRTRFHRRLLAKLD
jgi:hypothetical protein